MSRFVEVVQFLTSPHQSLCGWRWSKTRSTDPKEVSSDENFLMHLFQTKHSTNTRKVSKCRFHWRQVGGVRGWGRDRRRSNWEKLDKISASWKRLHENILLDLHSKWECLRCWREFQTLTNTLSCTSDKCGS
jgi:hypothetical protein